MIDANKLNYYTMAHRLMGFADGLADSDDRRYDSTIHMLRKSAQMMADVWNEYAEASGYDPIKDLK
jgi:hypothetical protein